MNRALTIGACCAALVAAATPSAFADADGDSRNCITRAEFKAIDLAEASPNGLEPPTPDTGTPLKRARKIIDSKGKLTSPEDGLYPISRYAWKHCGSKGRASIRFMGQGLDEPEHRWQAVDKSWHAVG